MKTFTAVFLAVAGLLMVGVGTTALAQGQGYVCQYNCRQACGTLNCYPGSYSCGGLAKNYLRNDRTLYALCNPGSGSCEVGDQDCDDQYYVIAGCGSGCCTVTTTIQACTGCQ
jgi:hypothetical protein